MGPEESPCTPPPPSPPRILHEWYHFVRGSLVHLLMIAHHCVRRHGSNSDQGGEGFNFLADMVSIYPLLWQRDVKLNQTQNIPEILIYNDNLMDVDEDSDEYTAGADLGNSGWGGRVCVNKGEALDRGTKCRAGGGYGRGVSPLPIWKKIKIRDCLDVFWSTPNSTLLCVFSILKEQIFDILWSLTYIVMLQMVNATV